MMHTDYYLFNFFEPDEVYVAARLTLELDQVGIRTDVYVCGRVITEMLPYS
jgi:hypothetical protein